MNPALQELAERQWRDYRAHTPGTYFAAAEPLLLEEAYNLQDAVARLRIAAGDSVIGYKVGCTGPGTTALFGMAGPIRGCLFRSELRRAGATIDPGAHEGLAIEGEMAIRIGDEGAPAEAFPVIELHNFVFRGARPTLAELVGNNGLNAGVVLPAEVAHSLPQCLETSATMTVRINGDVVGEGALWPMPDGPQASLDWLRSHLALHGLALSPGDLVLAGTALGLYRVRPGDEVSVALDDRAAVAWCRCA